MERIILIFLLLGNMNFMHAQESYHSYYNKLFFNIYTNAPDSSIIDFLNEYTPNFSGVKKANNSSSSWSSSTVKTASLPKTFSHSIFLEKHPFIESNYTKVEFKVYVDVYNNEKYKNAVQIKDFKVILYFNNLKDASNLFNDIKKHLLLLGKVESQMSSSDYFEIYSKDFIVDIPMRIRICITNSLAINGEVKVSFYSN